MNKKKIWTLVALSLAGISAYTIFHNCQKKCLICRYNLGNAITFTSGAVIGCVFYAYYLKN